MPNKFRETPDPEPEASPFVEEPAPEPKKALRSKNKGGLAKGLSKVFSGTFLTNEKTLKNIPFILFLACLAIVYIANGYYADDTIRKNNKITNELKELRSEYIFTKSDLMFMSKQSEVAKLMEPLGLKEPVVPPMKIETDSVKPTEN